MAIKDIDSLKVNKTDYRSHHMTKYTQLMIDRFGKDVMMFKADSEHFYVNVKVAVSRQFLSWVIALGEGAKIVGPESVVEQMRIEAHRLAEQYGSAIGGDTYV